MDLVGAVAMSAVAFATEKDLPGLVQLHETCYPAWPVYPAIWYQAHPTLVLREGRRVIGSTSFSLSFPPSCIPHDGEICYGHGISIHPKTRGQGLGRLLAEARHDAARDAGCKLFVGMTWPSNAAMLAIFAAQGLTKHQVLIGAYPWQRGEDANGWMFTGSLR